MSSSIIKLPNPHAGQIAVRSQAKRFNWLSAGRRWRKTTLVMALAVEAALQGKKVIWGAPVYDQCRVAYDETRRAVAGVATPNISRMTWDFPTGGQIIYRSLDNPDNVRGHTADGVVIDEAADVSPLAWHESLRPMLIDTKGWAWIIGTPKGLNWFAEGHAGAASRDDSMAWQVPTLGARIHEGALLREPHPLENPEIPWDEVTQLFATLSEQAFKQEILAEFLASDGAVFRNVDACLTAPDTTPDQHKGHLLVAGIDWAKQHDFTSVSVICCHCKAEVALDRFNQIGWALQRGRVLSLLHHWNVKFAYAETNSIGSPNLEAMQEFLPSDRTVTGFETTAKSKPKLIQALALCLEQARLRWLPDPVARLELIAYEATVTDAGHTKYGAPEGQWDDTVIARALAWKAASHRVPVELSEEEQIEATLPKGLRRENITKLDHQAADFAQMMRNYEVKQIKDKRAEVEKPWSVDVVDPTDDPWKQLEQMVNNGPL